MTIALIACCLAATAREDRKPWFAAEYTSEFQSNLSKKYNWANLLSLQVGFSPWKNGSFEIETLSAFKTRRERIAGDFQEFSNVEEDNMAINLFLTGYRHTLGDLLFFFAGVRNVNNDYFTQEYTSIFTNSSCGIYPTLSKNYPLADQPLSAMCLHMEFNITDNLLLKNSLYNGTASQLTDGARIFNINPRNDGVFNITELSYLAGKKKYGHYGLGFAVDYEGHAAKPEGGKRKFNYTIWGSVEKSVLRWGAETELGFLAQASVAPNTDLECRRYSGIGAVLKNITASKHGDHLAAFVNRAMFGHVAETAMEFTFKYGLNDRITIQPTFHHILTGSKRYNIALMRLCFTFEN
ncbi:MAG: carbohydrate porin [Rikenellaceae bacterium]|nr:carbohydrate porin [Rikenellaceae bacterium]